MAVWIGLTAGFLDLGLMILRKRLSDDDFYRLGDHFRWIIPAGVGVMVLLPGMAIALLTCLRRGRSGLGVVVGLLAFVGFLDLNCAAPLRVLGGTLLVRRACRPVRLVSRRPPRAIPVARSPYHCPLLVGAVLAIMLMTFGGKAWSEYRAVAALPPPPADPTNVLLIVWDTVRAGNLSLHGYGRRTSPNLERLAERGVRFDQAFATAPWTLPSHGSMFTGRWPHELTADWLSPLDESHPTLAEYLSRPRL